MKITVETTRTIAPAGDLFGIFFEDLNHAADGGLYPELVQNRSFEYLPLDNPAYTPFTGWEVLQGEGEVLASVQTGGAVSKKNPHYLSLDIREPGPGTGVMNVGYTPGMYLKGGTAYRFSCYALREQDPEEPMQVRLVDEEGRLLAETAFTLTEDWELYEAEIRPMATTTRGKLQLIFGGRGKVYLDLVSLMPVDTYKGLPIRKDLGEALEALHPKFMRFPGGCLTHDGALNPNARDSMYRWKNTIGPIKDRPSRRNNWNYNQSLGLGFYEYFLLAEALGAKPIPVISPGYDPHHHREASLANMWPWISDALDLIEFANGDEDTRWGALRASFGHPEPFGLEYLAIGNEEVGEAFFDRYKIVLDAVRRKYPEIKATGTAGFAAAGGEFERGWARSKETATDIVDEHYYMAPEWFLTHTDRYDTYDPEGPKVFVGEYASWGNTWYNALAEAAYMTSLENHADKVALACYAPLFCNEDYVNWKPDLIWFNNHEVKLTPNYAVQQLFMTEQGEAMVPVEASEVEPVELETANSLLAGDIGLGQQEDTTVSFTSISVRNADTGEIRTYPDVTVDPRHPFKRLDTIHWQRYTFRAKAKELAGKKGFKLLFARKSDENQLHLSVGGWQNQDMDLVETRSGRSSDLSHYLFSVEKNREYDVTIRVDGREVTVYVDGKEYQHTEVRPLIVQPLYISAQKQEKEWIVKVVNVTESAQEAELTLSGLLHLTGTKTVLSGDPAVSIHEALDGGKVIKTTEPFSMQSGDTVRFDPASVTVLRMHERFLEK